MKAFKLGFVLMLSFLMFLGIVTCSFGFFPAPIGPKSPTYPSYSNTTSSLLNSMVGASQPSSSYDTEMTKYQTDMKTYQEEQKTFIQNKSFPM